MADSMITQVRNPDDLITQVAPPFQSQASSSNQSITRADVHLQPYGSQSEHRDDFPAHSPVLANDEDEEDEREEKGERAAAGADADDAPVSCLAAFFCCRKKKPKADKAKPANYASNNRDNDSSVSLQAPSSQVTQAQAAAAGANGGAAAGGAVAVDYGGANRPITQIPRALLAPMLDIDKNRKTLVLDLDETLVHSSFKPIPNADFIISIELESVIHRVYVLKRPGVDAFLRAVGARFEVVVFTASLAKYADPLLDILDRGKVVRARLFREACVHHYGNYVKDLSHLGRRLEWTVIIDNSPFSYMFQPDNAIPITSWFNDKNDRQLFDLVPFLDSIANVDDVCQVLHRRKLQMQNGLLTPP